MKKIKIILLLASSPLFPAAFSQNTPINDTIIIDIDMLSAPQSPAASLLGFAESEILKPETPTDFTTSFQKSTNDFTEIPSSFAVDFRIAHFFKKENNSIDSMCSSDPLNSFKQTALISLGYKNFDVLNDSIFRGQGLGIGFKFSLVNGKLRKKDGKQELVKLQDRFHENIVIVRTSKEYIAIESFYKFKIDSVQQKMRVFKEEKLQFNNSDLEKVDKEKEKELQFNNSDLEKVDKEKEKELQFNNSDLEKVDKEKEEELQFNNSDLEKVEDFRVSICALERERDYKLHEILEKNVQEHNEKEEKLVKEIEGSSFRNYGAVFDIAAGLVTNFPDNRIEYSVIQKAALWATFGYEFTNGVSILGMLRSSYNQSFVFKNESDEIVVNDLTTYDFGARFIYDFPNNKFSISSELIRRGVPNSPFISTYRTTLNIGYGIRKNTRLSFVFGKDFEGNYTLDNNLISSLNLTFGFGSKKEFRRKQN